MARESGPKLPIPRPSTAHGKPGRRGDGRRPAANRDAPGNPQPGPPAPLPPLPPLGQRLPGAGDPAGRLRAIGEESWAAVDTGARGAAGHGGRSLTCWSPARAPGWAVAARRGLGSAQGSGQRAQAQRPRGRDPRIPQALPPSRLRRSAWAPGLGGRRGLGLGAGSGAGPAWARPGAPGPRAGSAPERRVRGSARGAAPARLAGRATQPRRGARPPPLIPGAPCRRRPPTQTRTDRHADAHRPADASPQRATHADLDRRTPTNIGTHATQARVHRHAPPRCLGDPTPDIPFIHVDTGMTWHPG